MTDTPALTVEQAAALAAARELARAGVPVFVAPPSPTSNTGFALPDEWQQTVPDPDAVDQWRPGWALAAVMGCGLDLIDVDPRNGGDLDSLNGSTPRSWATAVTPSGGVHSFVASLGTGSRDGVLPGVDIKGGAADGSGRGFAFLPPTVRPSKVTGEPAAYRWVKAPERVPRPGEDDSGANLAARIRELRGAGVRTPGGPSWWAEFLASREPQSVAAAQRAIDEKLTEVSGWAPNDGANFRTTLMRAAMTLGGYVGGGWLDETDAWSRLEAAVCEVWGAPDSDDRLWIGQGLGDGATQPFHVYTPEDEQRYGEAAQAVAATRTGPSWSPQRALGAEAFDPAGAAHDQEFAEAVAARTAPVLRFAVDTGTWLKRRQFEVWAELPDQAPAAVADVARLMPLGSTPVPKDAVDRTPEHWQAVRRASFLSSPGAGRIERKLRAIVAGGDHPCTVDLAELDTDPEVLWAGGTPWDLRASGEVPTPAPVHPDTPHLRTALCAPQAAPTPVWDRFVAAVFPDPDVRAWALRVLSLTLAGYPDAALPVLYGPERTGKTALITLLVRALGSYGHAADPRLLGGADHTHASVVYALKGRRLSFIDEGPRRGHLAAERLKQLTGGGQLTGNAMRSNPVTFSPTHTLVMTTNDEPPITDPALRARVRLIPCEADAAEVRAARQALTGDVWTLEAPGVLAALMRETAAWLAEPDSATTAAGPAEIRERLTEMAAAQDPVGEWVELCTLPSDPGTPSRELYRRFVAWHEAQPTYRRQSAPSETAFGRTLTELGYPRTHAGERGKVKYRPLSVMNGGGGPAPWEPSGSPAVPPVAAGLPPVAAGSEPQPAAADNPRSDPVSTTSAAGAAGLSRSMNDKNDALVQKGDTGANTQGNTGEAPNRRQNRVETGSDQAPPVDSATGGKPAAPEPEGHGSVTATPGADDHGTDPDSSRSVTNSTVAARADQDKISKAEARAQLKAEQRAAAVAEAGGPVLGLPAVVDRAGTVAPLSLEQAESAVRHARSGAGALTVDVETSGYPVGHAEYVLRSVQLGGPGMAVVFDPAEPAQREVISRCLAEAGRLHAHSATADLVPLVDAGLITEQRGWALMHDTVIPAKLADPASTGSDPGLKQLAGAVLGEHATAPAADEARAALFKAGKWLSNTKAETPVARSGWAQVATGCEVMLRYAASDVLDTAALAEALPEPSHEVLLREQLAQRMTARVTHRGVRLDADHIGELTIRHTGERDAAAARVRAFGIDNPGSNPQVAEALGSLGAPLPRTKAGAASVAVAALEPLSKREDEIGRLAAAVLDYRHHDTVLGTFLAPYAQLCERGDGRARPTVYTLGTDTGRMSCVRPNLQQLPRTGGVRACLTADSGHVLVSADFSGVELRVAAALSQDPTLLRFIAEGRDLHAEVARQVWGESAGKAERYVAKRIVFGRLYGGGIPTLAAQGGVSESIAASAVENLDALTPQLARWSASVRDAVKAGRTQFPSYSGRVIHLPREYPHKAPNYCIQGTARELLVDALGRWADTVWSESVLLPVHDELVVAVPEADAEAATDELVRAMGGEIHGVPIVAEPSAPSFAWADST